MWRLLASVLFLLSSGGAHAAEPLIRFASEKGEHVDIGADNLEEVRWVEDDLNGSRIFSFRLDRTSAELVGDLSLKLIYKPIKLIICGDLVAKPVVNEPLMHGSFHVAVETAQRAKMLADVLKRGNCE